MAANWPINSDALRTQLQIAPGSDDEAELQLYVAVACERIDEYTGRDLEPSRHERAGNLPKTFVLAARATAALWWRQDKNGPRNRPGGPPGGAAVDVPGPPAGIDLPSKVMGWLTPYPPRLYPPAETVFAPVKLTWANGWTLDLSRQGAIVTGVLTTTANAASSEVKAIPAEFAAAGDVRNATYNSATAPTLVITLNEVSGTGATGIQAAGVAPAGTTLTIQWVAAS